MVKISKGLVEEAKTIIRMYWFLKQEYGLREADRLNARKLREVRMCFSSQKVD